MIESNESLQESFELIYSGHQCVFGVSSAESELEFVGMVVA